MVDLLHACCIVVFLSSLSFIVKSLRVNTRSILGPAMLRLLVLFSNNLLCYVISQFNYLYIIIMFYPLSPFCDFEIFWLKLVKA